MSTATLHKEKNKTLVPQLRFPEFDGEWNEKKLKNVSTYFNGGSFENDVKEEGEYELITLKSVDMSGNLAHSKRYIDNEVPTLRKDTLIMILSEQAPGLLGMTALIPEENKYVLNQRVAEIRPKDNIVSYFLSMAINRNQQYFSKHGAGTKVQNISKPNVENYTFLYPELPEQQKIASFLSAVDEKIQQLSRKKELLSQYKKGVMQHLFSGKLRFKDDNGKNYADWEEKSISSVCKRSSGKSKSENIIEDGKNIIVDMGSISRDCKLIGNKRTNCQEDYLETNELVMVKDDIGGGNIIGKVVMIPFNNKYVCGDHVYRLKVVNGDVSYIYFAINSYEVNKSFRRKANGTAQIGINNRTVDEQKIPFPCFAEQQKIANFLSSIDTKIESTNQQINQMQSFKKGLLQQLFV
jgi:type I restriction enzyme S subunit